MGRRSRLRLAAAITLSAALAAPGHAASVEGVEFAERIEWNGTPLQLTGVGVLRYRLFLKGYVAALYLGPGIEAERALEDVPRRIEIEYLWAIPAEGFARATVDGIARNADAASLAGFSGSVERLNALYEDVEPGDRYSLTYVPGVGTELALNGEPRGLIEGAEFSAALFAIWIGGSPIDEPLRDQLLERL